MNFAYSDTQNDIRNAVKGLCDRYGPDYWRSCDEAGAYPEEFVSDMADAGWLAALIP